MKSIDARIRWTAGFFIFLFLVVAARLFEFGVVDHQFYQALADNQQQIIQQITPQRGAIYAQDKNGKLVPLAINKETYTVYANNKLIAPANRQSYANALSAALQISAVTVATDLSVPTTYEPLARKLDAATAQQVQNLNLSGVYTEKESTRFYPEGMLAANIIGFLGYGPDGITRTGQYGVEQYYNNALSGTPGKIVNTHDSAGTPIDNVYLTKPKDGANLVLTIDPNVEFYAQQVLQEAAASSKAAGGTVIVMNPQDGSIIAMVDTPTFNPNDYGNVPNAVVYSNEAVSGEYEPGSIFKPITISSVMNVGKITPSTTYQDNGVDHIDGYNIYDWNNKAWGLRTMTDVLAWSLNLGAIDAEEQVPHSDFLQYIKKFMFGKDTGIDLPGETPGNLNNLNDTQSNINYATASFGQGILVTPIQILRAIAAIANGGKLVVPHIAKEIQYVNGTTKTIAPAPLPERAISPETSQTVTKMLIAGAEKGFANVINVPGYFFAGKTGTAQVAETQKAGYSNSTDQSIVSYFPAYNPQFVMIMRLDKPNLPYAEDSVGPFMKQIEQYILNYYAITPDYNPQNPPAPPYPVGAPSY
ncbi:penicillin-binding protein 2 [Patescibacteria group bacterium]|jgi:cell division protein FtsI/penicillin-binding protein 2|nr:penicillin-binding protein 2 [Patescibacteria group bacterium]